MGHPGGFGCGSAAIAAANPAPDLAPSGPGCRVLDQGRLSSRQLLSLPVLNRHDVRRRRKVVPQVLDLLQFLRFAQIEYRWRRWIHANLHGRLSQVSRGAQLAGDPFRLLLLLHQLLKPRPILRRTPSFRPASQEPPRLVRTGIGDRFQERIEESIRLYDKVMIVLSEHSWPAPGSSAKSIGARTRGPRKPDGLLSDPHRRCRNGRSATLGGGHPPAVTHRRFPPLEKTTTRTRSPSTAFSAT